MKKNENLTPLTASLPPFSLPENFPSFFQNPQNFPKISPFPSQNLKTFPLSLHFQNPKIFIFVPIAQFSLQIPFEYFAAFEMETHLTQNPRPASSVLNSSDPLGQSDETLASSPEFNGSVSPLSERIFSSDNDNDNDPSSDSDGFSEPRDYGLSYRAPVYGSLPSSSHWATPWSYESSGSTWQQPWSSSGVGMEEESRVAVSEAEVEVSPLIDWVDRSADVEIKPLFADMIDEPEPEPEPVPVPIYAGAGLANLGNTCFLNVILQCFTYTVPLLQGLLASTAHKAPCENFYRGFCVFCNLFELIEISLCSGVGVVSPTKFVCNLNYFSSSFRRFQQEDAHEFLQCFLDKLESFGNYHKQPESENLVKKVFGGRLVSKLKCCNCGHCSDTYEPMIDLSLEIDEVSNLFAALHSFTKIEKIEDPETKFTCENCKEKVSVEKQLKLDQVPPVVTFHLKRFKNDGSFVEKIDNHVAFPLELDLLPYTGDNQSDKMTYELYAVVVHTGFSSTSGHYYCFIRTSPGEWVRFDDSKASYVHQDYVLDQEAYILFYAKEGTPSFSTFMSSNRQHMDPSLLHTSPKSVLDMVDARTRSPNMPVKCCIEAIETSDVATACAGPLSGSRDREVTLSERSGCMGVVDGSAKKDREESIPEGINCRGDGIDKTDDPESAPPLVSNNPVATSSEDKESAVVTAAEVVNLPEATRSRSPRSSSPPVLKGNNFVQKSFELGNKIAEPPTFSDTPRSPSPEIYREDPPDAAFSIPRDHLRVIDPNSCKRAVNKEQQDLGRKQACNFVKKNVHGSRRGEQLIAAIYGPQNKGSDSKKRARGMRTSPTRDNRGSATRRRGVGISVLASSMR